MNSNGCYRSNQIDSMDAASNHSGKHSAYDAVEMNGIETEKLQPKVITPTSKRDRRRLRRRKQLVSYFVILLLSVCIVALVVAYISLLYTSTRATVCLTPECLATASFLTGNMNTSIDPCDDFFEYACGGWIKKNPIPSDRVFWGIDSILWKETQEFLKELIEEDIERYTESSSERKAKELYQSCMNKEQIENAQGEPMKQLIERLQGWYGLGSWNENTWNMLDMLILLHGELWNDPFFAFGVGVDDKNSKRNIIQIDQGGLGLMDKSYYLGNHTTVINAYREFMATIAGLLGADQRKVEQFVEDVMKFETALAEITIPEDQMLDARSLYNKFTLDQLNQLAPAINWLDFYKGLFPNMTSSTEVIVSSPTYLRNMSRIIQSTHPRVLNNYLIWHVTQQNVPGLSLHFRYAAEKMSNIVENTRTTKEAWRECVGVVDGKFGMELGAVFVKRKFPAESKKRVEDMIEDIKLSFHHIFDTLEWMDELTKDKAREKLNATFDMIGYPDYILDTEYMDKYYEKMTIVKDDFFQNIQSSLNFEYENAKKKLNSPVEKYNWDMTPPEINAYYGNNNNAIVFPAGLLQWPFYDPTFPRYVNFAGVGTVIGHELTHAFDNWGAQFDKDGNINNWWTDESWDKFERRSQCLVDLYSQYVMEGTRVNGLLTMGENMADIGGLTQSYFAYKQMESREGTELPLAGLNLTQEQTFFLAYSQTWCIVRRPHSLKNHILTDEHAPEKLRVLVPLMHMTEFAEAYQCPLGSPMNPVDRCDDDRRLWW